MHAHNYLCLSKHRIYYFRYPIPAFLHQEHKQSHIRLSLETRCPKEALRLYRGLVYLGDSLMSDPVVQQMEYAEVRAALFKHFQQMRDQIKVRINTAGALPYEDMDRYRLDFAEAADAFKKKDYALIATDNRLDDVILTQNLPIEKGTSDYALLQLEYVRHFRDYSESVLEYNSRFEKVNFKTDPIILKAQAKQRKDKGLKVCIDEYIQIRIRGGWDPKTVAARRSIFAVLVDFWGEERAVDIPSEEANEFYLLLIDLPKNARVLPELKNLLAA